MCLIIKGKQRIKIAKEDIVVYKTLYTSLHSRHMGFKYKFNVKYETELTFANKKEDYICSDHKELNIVYSYLDKIKISKGNFLQHIKEDLVEKNIISFVKEGFHSYRTTDRISDTFSVCIYKCIIPKGSRYYIGIDKDLLVSNQIIIKK